MSTVTLKQVALEARVSYLTALRAMGSSPGQVRAATAQRVRQAADRLEYRPNPAARALTSQTSPYIGLLYGVGPGCSRRIGAAEMMRAYAEFYFELTGGLEMRDYHVLTGGTEPHLAGTDDEQDDDRDDNSNTGLPKLLHQRHVGGLVVVGDIWPALHREIIRRRLPTVGIYCQSVAHVPTVDLNYQVAARLCTQHLLELGHRRIAFVPGRYKTWKTEPMQLGYLAALAEAGVKPAPTWNQLRDSADVVGERVRATRGTAAAAAPSAFVVYDDYEAVRVIDRLAASRLRVPDDVSLAAVQNMGPGAVRRPTVTGCPIPAVHMARRAVELLMEQMRNKRHVVRDELIDASLLTGDSSARPKVQLNGKERDGKGRRN